MKRTYRNLVTRHVITHEDAPGSNSEGSVMHLDGKTWKIDPRAFKDEWEQVRPFTENDTFETLMNNPDEWVPVTNDTAAR